MLNDDLIKLLEFAWQFIYFMSSGGYVLWSIFALNLLIWMLMLERYWYFERVFPVLLAQSVNQWMTREDVHSWYAQSIRTMIIAGLKAKLTKNLTVIHTFVELLPILGLMGTIIAMIEMFEVLNLYGTGNARALAGSISKALLTTLAGLLSAIPGLFLIGLLQQKAHQKIAQLSDQLPISLLDQESEKP